MRDWFDAGDEAGRYRISLLAYSLIVFGSFATIKIFSGSDSPTWIALPFVSMLAGGLGVLLQWALMSLVGPLLRGTAAVRKGSPLLGKAQVAIRQERWDEAKAELESQWSRFPGHLDVVREYERLYLEGYRAPAAGASWLMGALARVQGGDRAYVYLRLAELHADGDLRNPGEAVKWCRRLLAEFPSAHEAPTARAILDQLKPSGYTTPHGNGPA